MIFKQPLWFIKSDDFQFFGSILPCYNVVDWSDTHLKFCIFKCLSFKHSLNRGLTIRVANLWFYCQFSFLKMSIRVQNKI